MAEGFYCPFLFLNTRLQDCERDSASKSGPAAEQLGKCKASLAEFEATVKNMDPLKFANSMKVEAEFKGGDGLQL